MHHPTDKISHSMAFARPTPVAEYWLEQKIDQCVYRERSILSEERDVAPW